MLPGVNLPSDISATDRYFDRDITEPPFVLGPSSSLKLPEGLGIGLELRPDRLAEAEARWREHNPFAPLL
ncbi:MAG: hypothetical protein F4X87_01675 [Chloroflexi bacterium]|nr:hypothetical protein [Chloroflexota bacterium]